MGDGAPSTRKCWGQRSPYRRPISGSGVGLCGGTNGAEARKPERAPGGRGGGEGGTRNLRVALSLMSPTRRTGASSMGTYSRARIDHVMIINPF